MNRTMTMWRYSEIRKARNRIKHIRKCMREPDGHNVWATNQRMARDEILLQIAIITSCRNSLRSEG